MEGIKGEKGFTLIEVIISILIFSLVITIFCSILSLGTKITQRSKKITKNHNNAATVLAGETVTGANKVIDGSTTNMTITFATTSSIVVPGNYYTVDIADTKYKYFSP